MSKIKERNINTNLIIRKNEFPSINLDSLNLINSKNKEDIRIKKSESMKNNIYNFRKRERNISRETNSNNSIIINSVTKMDIRSCILEAKNEKKIKYKLENEKNSRINSFEMENLLKNQSKLCKKRSKQEKFIDFFINDNNKNSIYNLHDNSLTTTKYNLFTFIPKGLLYQFSSWSNIYFLFTAIIQSIPIISPINLITAIIPLIFVLGLGMIREAIEDFGRYNYDKLNNKEEVIVFRNNKFIRSVSKTLRHGEVILIYENNTIPADIILIDSKFKDGRCYVETSSLDGEKNLKLKVANKYTQGFVSKDVNSRKNIEKYINPQKYLFSGHIKINAPNPNLSYVNGNIHFVFKKKDYNIEQDINITNNEFILKGSILKSTSWIVGIVVYTGKNNKIILNAKRPRLKISKTDKKLNLYLTFVFFLLIFLCVECAVTYNLQFKKLQKFYSSVLLVPQNTMKDSIIIFFTYFLLLNTLIPISLIVSIEIIKIIQGVFIEWDILLYSNWRHCFCSVKGFSINEELGNVNFIFADKTGTLTKNQLQFKYCIIGNKFYKYQKLGETDSIINLLDKFSNRQDSLASYEIVSRQSRNIRRDNYYDNSKIMMNKTNNNYTNIMKEDSKNGKINNDMFVTYQEGIKKKKIRIEGNNKFIKNKSLFSIDNNKSSSKKISSIYSNNMNKNEKINNYNYNYNNISSYYRSNQRENNDKIFEENEFSFYLKGIIRINEGYFANPENNSFLKAKSVKNVNSINYKHEFWIALALANECMIKYEHGEVRYIGTSLDDLELVRTAHDQGYKLIETTVNGKTIEINGKNYYYEVLQVLGFSSERKRMSIIVKYRNEIFLYIKGADSEISKRLSKKNLKYENYDAVSNGLIEFSKEGLRTLMIAFRKIKNEDYNLWRNKLYEEEINEKNIEKRNDLHERLYDIIENNLILLGGTVVEDKLQDNVPQTIKELKNAGIKIWILTGDKLDTAESIGYNCNLLSKDQKIFVLKIMNNEEENIVLNKSFKELNNFFKEFQEFIIALVKKYNSESQYLDNNWIYNNSNIRNYNIEITQDNNVPLNKQSNTSFNFSSINFELFNYILENDILEPFSIIIESPVLNLLFKDEEMTKDFVKIAYYSNTVICCRISPSQKSEIIQKIKKFDKNVVTLAIGDGSNDVSMITEANIGVGIHGEEGVSAIQASDFAIGEFQLLKRLLFIHGRSNLYRISKMIIYFFYKNFIFSFCQFYYSTRCLASGQSIIDEWYVTCYNLIFTSIPLCIRALTDTDIDINDEKNISKNLALLYKENRDKNDIFNFKKLILNFIKGIFFSYIFYVSGFDNEILIHGYNKNMSYVSLRIYISIIVVVSMNLLIQSHFIVFLLPLSIGISLLLLILFLVINHYGLFFDYDSKASLIVPITSSQFILGILYISFINFIFEYSLKLFRIYFNNSLSSELLLKKNFLKKDEINNIYPYNPNKISNTLKEKVKEDKSNISFISKKSSLNKLNLNNQNKKLYLSLSKLNRLHEIAKNEK